MIDQHLRIPGWMLVDDVCPACQDIARLLRGHMRRMGEPVDTDIRCPHHTPAGQCLDHQGHLGDHQYPQETRDA